MRPRPYVKVQVISRLKHITNPFILTCQIRNVGTVVEDMYVVASVLLLVHSVIFVRRLSAGSEFVLLKRKPNKLNSGQGRMAKTNPPIGHSDICYSVKCKIDSGVQTNVMPIHVYRQLYPD